MNCSISRGKRASCDRRTCRCLGRSLVDTVPRALSQISELRVCALCKLESKRSYHLRYCTYEADRDEEEDWFTREMSHPACSTPRALWARHRTNGFCGTAWVPGPTSGIARGASPEAELGALLTSSTHPRPRLRLRPRRRPPPFSLYSLFAERRTPCFASSSRAALSRLSRGPPPSPRPADTTTSTLAPRTRPRRRRHVGLRRHGRPLQDSRCLTL